MHALFHKLSIACTINSLTEWKQRIHFNFSLQYFFTSVDSYHKRALNHKEVEFTENEEPNWQRVSKQHIGMTWN